MAIPVGVTIQQTYPLTSMIIVGAGEVLVSEIHFLVDLDIPITLVLEIHSSVDLDLEARFSGDLDSMIPSLAVLALMGLVGLGLAGLDLDILIMQVLANLDFTTKILRSIGQEEGMPAIDWAVRPCAAGQPFEVILGVRHLDCEVLMGAQPFKGELPREVQEVIAVIAPHEDRSVLMR